MKLRDVTFGGISADGLMRSVKAGRIAHAFLLTGPHGVGKKSCADLIARAILCQSDDPPCGECPECKKYLAGSHPDVHVVTCEGRSIYVDDIRALREKLALKPFSGVRHIAIIRQADRLTPQAQNALLKTLEEPTGDTVFFMITDQPGVLLPTVVSRCRPLRLFPLSMEKCAQALVENGISEKNARELAGWAQGSVGRALEIAADDGYPALRGKVLASLEALSEGRSEVARAISLLGDVSKNARNVLEIMEVAARDRMAAENGGTPMTDSARIQLDGRALLMGVMEIRRMLAQSVSFSGALEKMYLELARASAEHMED